ncbi:MAG TPA: hypothetical protein PK156_19760 [Polyangium sp.]|nr:hypothetical protein [Polyangium sp.]
MQSVITRTAFLGFLSLTTACTSSTQVVQPQAPPQGGVLEFRLDSYDGRIIKGRLLLSATQSMFRIDSRRAGWYALQFDRLHACGKPELIPYFEFDYMFSPIPPEVIIPIHPGKWYGQNVEFSISDYLVGHGEGPDCIETEFSARTSDRQTIAILPIRIERTDKPAALGMSQ